MANQKGRMKRVLLALVMTAMAIGACSSEISNAKCQRAWDEAWLFGRAAGYDPGDEALMVDLIKRGPPIDEWPAWITVETCLEQGWNGWL